jgi:predicted PolB exonuclease-like 3'-5' exonuclease
MMNTTVTGIDCTKILFLDIETVPQYSSVLELDDVEHELWQKKSARLVEDGMSDEDLYKKAGIFAEFGKIICISAAFLRPKNGSYEMRVRSFYGDDEKEILNSFMAMVNKYFNTKKIFFCAHNGKEFDFPFIARRALINGIQIPLTLDSRGMKPWEIQHLDTMELMRFGSSNMSLRAACLLLGIKDPKEHMDGEDVWECFKRHDMAPIGKYCDGDVEAERGVFTALRNCTGDV